ncbi:hypothetical protein GCM10010276_79070 [Streptomyces longisporus]|uniref:Uncharacterized protein n=1 Tax=Streptomyces longisporus TaxID=1948 RepID=A0ABN3NE63_STRLO
MGAVSVSDLQFGGSVETLSVSAGAGVREGSASVHEQCGGRSRGRAAERVYRLVGATAIKL